MYALQPLLSSVFPHLQVVHYKAMVIMQHSHSLHLTSILTEICFPLPHGKVLPFHI